MAEARARWRRLDREERVIVVAVGLVLAVVNVALLAIAVVVHDPAAAIGVGWIDGSIAVIAGALWSANRLVRK